MKIRCMVIYQDNLWVAMSLEFGLAAQAFTKQEVMQKLNAQIADYVEEALTIDIAHKDYLLNRKAPFSFYALYYWLLIKDLFTKGKPSLFFQTTLNAHA